MPPLCVSFLNFAMGCLPQTSSDLVTRRTGTPRSNSNQIQAFFPALILAQRAFCAALMFAIPAALILRPAFFAGFTGLVLAWILAHLNLAAALILALWAGLIFRLAGLAD